MTAYIYCNRCGYRTTCESCRQQNYYDYHTGSSKRYVAASCQTDSAQEFSFARFLKAEELTDVEIVVESDRFPGQRGIFKAHRLVLALQNEVFRAMFYGNFPKEERVVITDLHPEGVLGLLRYFYSGKLEVDSVHQALCTRSAAIKYLEPKLSEMCAIHVKSKMTAKDVCPVLDYVLSMGEDVSSLPARALIQKESLSVISSKEFGSCLACTVHFVLDHAVKVPEVTVMRAVHSWALNRQQNSPKLGAEETSLRKIMLPFFSKLRFLALTAQDFVSGPNQWGALSDCEARALLSNIIQRSSLPWPAGFCKTEGPR
uniref:BTB domain-containing protein n=1 Tax=Amblyomma triste TaxID=251400 RepID=A0A023GBP4_AMBTT